MKLETNRLLLNSPDLSFAKPLLAYYMENKTFLQPFEPKREASFYSVEEQRSNLGTEIDLQNKKLSYKFYLFQKDSPNKIIGSVALNNVVWGAFRSCFIGYKLSSDCVNCGYMTEAVEKIVKYAFEDLKLHRIEGNVMPKNKPSLAVLEKCGFVREGYSPKYLQINGVWEDHIHMVLINENL